MKKLLTLVLGTVLSFGAVAQSDTVTEFFTGTPTLYTVGAAGDGGYVTGNNGYGDLMKMMKFDTLSNFNTPASINGVLLAIPVIADNGGSFKVKSFVWENDSTLGAELNSTTIQISTVDTSAAGFSIAEGAVAYNVAVNFATPLFISSGDAVVIGVELPTTAGDTIVVLGNSDENYANCETNTFEVWDDGTFINFTDSWGGGANIAMGIYPTITPSLAGVESVEISLSVYPNPAIDVLNFNINEEIEMIEVYSVNGMLVKKGTSKQMKVADLKEGAYIYNVLTKSGKVSNGTFVKK
jgi:hypothetical protein